MKNMEDNIAFQLHITGPKHYGVQLCLSLVPNTQVAGVMLALVAKTIARGAKSQNKWSVAMVEQIEAEISGAFSAAMQSGESDGLHVVQIEEGPVV